MPNKEVIRFQANEMKTTSALSPIGSIKTAVVAAKACVGKANAKESAMSPSGPSSMEDESTELLGSLTTQQQQRTSARVIKKLRLEPPAGDKRDIPECETPNKIDEKDALKFPTVKQRMPKALWSTDEKSLFFEALNEYGKDFDAITAYICAKMKKKGMPDVNLKTKTQVSHFYYRTWHKLSKHVHFDENVKKVAQELYALINYGELRKKLVSVNEKTCARLGEMVLGGSIMVRARGRNVRVRTPMCRALRKLNQISERACGVRVWSRAQIVLRARDAESWARVQAAAHNPRASAALHMRVRLADFIQALHLRWRSASMYKMKRQPQYVDAKDPEEELSNEKYESILGSPRPQPCEDKEEDKEDLEGHLNLEPDRIIVEEQKLPKKPVLHVGPKPSAEIHLPVVSPSEQLSSQKICFSSYLERMYLQRQDKEGVASKIRAPKRQRKDSATEKDKDVDQKKIKVEEIEPKLMDIDETAVDGIELMANFKIQFEDEEKPSTEDEKDPKAEETAEEDIEREKDMSEREKDSFSEMEDDEKYNKSDSDNESDHGKTDKSEKKTKFKNLKVKFRIRPKKRGGSIYTLVPDKESEDVKIEEPVKIEEESKTDIDVETALKQIRKGWSVYDAGDLTIGDLYLMFGSRSKLELDYWWAEPTPPLPRPITKTQKLIEPDKISVISDKDKNIDKKEKVEKPTEKGTDSSVEDDKERARESDTDIFSPKNTFGQDSNDGMSGDEKKGEQLASPEHKLTSAGCGTLKLASKLINRPQPQQKQDSFSMIGSRLQRLLALVGNPYVTSGCASATISRCNCGHVCSQQRKQKPQASPAAVTDAVFRHPTPIAPKPDGTGEKRLALDGLPRYRRGRPRSADRQVVVQRLLPLLPKLPLTKNLVPVKMVPNSPAAPIRILPKPSPPHVSNSSHTYILSESNGQYFFHDGDRRVPITPVQDYSDTETQDENTSEESDLKECKIEMTSTDVTHPPDKDVAKELNLEAAGETSVTQNKSENSDIANFLPSESLSLSPSRLLRESDGWLEGSVQDFSLSSFLGHLEGRPQPYLGVDSHLQSLMAESSVDYVAKFADLAAEVSDEITPLAEDLS